MLIPNIMLQMFFCAAEYRIRTNKGREAAFVRDCSVAKRPRTKGSFIGNWDEISNYSNYKTLQISNTNEGLIQIEFKQKF